LNQEDAWRVWHELSGRFTTLDEFLADYLAKGDHGRMPFQDVMSQLVFPIGADREDLIALCVRERRPVLVHDAKNDPRVSERLRTLLAANEFVCVPLIAKAKPLGAILADNLYSGRPITHEQVQLLAMFATQAALAIETAEAYEKVEDQMRQLKQAQDRLLRSERLATVGEMAAHVAHEIRNPLVTIGGFARVILRGLDPNSPQASHAKIIVEEVMRLENILKNVMDFTKPSAPQKVETDINRILEDTCKLIQAEATPRSVTVSESFDPGLPRITADPAQMKQAFLNIMRNALESMDRGGCLSVRTQGDHSAIVIVISDTGRGIPDSVLKHIFDPFFTTKPQGTGLGLAVTRKVVEEHGGDVVATSKVGSGTTFTITLPR
jgi:signal transduction histidine kinase